MVALVLFGLLFAVVFDILATNRTSWDVGSTKQTVENQGRLGLESMTRELYRTDAGKITISVPGDTITFQIPLGYDSGGSGILLWGAEGTPNYYIRYIIVNNQLLRQILDSSLTPLNSSTRVLANDAQSLGFSVANNLLTITLTIQRMTSSNNLLSQTFSSKVTFRN